MTEYFVDGFIIVVMLFFMISGYFSGFSGKLLSLFTWGGSIAIAYYLNGYLVGFFKDYTSSELVQKALSFGSVFLIGLIFLSLLTGQLSQSVRSSRLGGVDRVLGILMGGLLGSIAVMICTLFLHFFVNFRAGEPRFLKNSTLYPVVKKTVSYAKVLLPTSLRDYLTPQTHPSSTSAEATNTLSRVEQKAASNPAKTQQGYHAQDRSDLATLVGKVDKGH